MRCVTAFLFCVFSASVSVAGPTSIEWSELPDPSAQSYQDPFLNLRSGDLRMLARIVRLQELIYLPDTSEADRKRVLEELKRLRIRLADANIDADWMISQRRNVRDLRQQAATAGNPAIDGQTISIAGYAIPAPPSDDGTAVAYLVPERGLCSHAPPPHPNQMVRLRLTADWQPALIHEPVRVTGVLRISPSVRRIHVTDGEVAMKATFDLEVEHFETNNTLKLKPGAALDLISYSRRKIGGPQDSGNGE